MQMASPDGWPLVRRLWLAKSEQVLAQYRDGLLVVKKPCPPIPYLLLERIPSGRVAYQVLHQFRVPNGRVGNPFLQPQLAQNPAGEAPAHALPFKRDYGSCTLNGLHDRVEPGKAGGVDINIRSVQNRKESRLRLPGNEHDTGIEVDALSLEGKPQTVLQ